MTDIAVEAVKTAIISGTATIATVTSLQRLLSSSKNDTESASTPRTTAKPPGPARSTKKAATPSSTVIRSKRHQEIKIREDESPSLAPRARYALATEIVNIGLKALPQTMTASVKSPKKAQMKFEGRSSASESALQPRSVNATPVHDRPTGSGRSSPKCSSLNTPPDTAHLKAVSDCAHLAFSYLRSVDINKLNVKPLLRNQLENGMLSLAGRMINAGLDSLAVKELRIIKRLLEQSSNAVAKQGRTAKTKTNDPETMASLLRFDLDLASRPDLLPMVVTFHLHLLRILARSRNPSAVEEAAQYLRPGTRGSPVQAIQLLMEATGDVTKASRQLETVANLILQMCPGVSTAADEAAQDPSRGPEPVAVFQLQTCALEIRKEMWKLVEHEVDFEKELAEPFARCLDALMRRVSGQKQTVTLYEICKGAYSDLGLNVAQSSQVRSSATFSSLRVLSILAHQASLHEHVYEWADLATKQCEGLEAGHARFATASTMRLSAHLACLEKAPKNTNLLSAVLCVNQCLEGKLTGSAADFEMLLEETARLVRRESSAFTDDKLRSSWRMLVCLSAGFASRYAKSYTDSRSCRLALQIINAAVSLSRTTEDLISWTTRDTVQTFVRLGALEKVSEAAATKPLTQAWSTSAATFTLSRILKALVVKSASSQTKFGVSAIIDEALVDATHLGPLFECLLRHILELAHKRRYQSSVRSILLEIVERLDKIYSFDAHPIRRARVAAIVLRGCEQFPEVLSPDVIHGRLRSPAIDTGSLGMDEGLQAYLPDIGASLAVAKAFQDGCPNTEALAGSITAWRTLLDAPGNTTSLDHVVDNPRVLVAQLVSLEGYLGVTGDDLLRAEVAQLLYDAGGRCGATVTEQYSFAAKVAMAQVSLGYAERAESVLENVRGRFDIQGCEALEALDYTLCRVEVSLSLDRVLDGQEVLETARAMHCALEQQDLRSSQAFLNSIQHGRGWLLHSQVLLALARPEQSLRSARRAVKLLSGIWVKLERSINHTEAPKTEGHSEYSEAEPVDRLASKVSKLNLQPQKTAASQSSDGLIRKGAKFWPVARVLCRAFLHLADLYVHHGIFNEANYASEQAVKTAEACQSRQLLDRVRYHRSILLTAAGRTEEAELSLAQGRSDTDARQTLATIELLRAQAILSAKNGEYKSAFKSIDEAEEVARELQSSQPAQCEEALSALMSGSSASKPGQPTKIAKQPAKPGPQSKSSRTTTVGKTNKKAAAITTSLEPYMLRKLETRLKLEKAAVSLKTGHEKTFQLAKLADTCAALSGTFKWRQFEYESFMSELSAALEADFAFNALPETTLSFPALQCSGRKPSLDVAVAASSSDLKSTRPTKPMKRKVSAPTHFASLLAAARQSMAVESLQMNSLTTSEIHKQYAMASNASLLLSATSTSQASSVLHPVREALSLDIARIHATQCQNTVTSLEREIYPTSKLNSWPLIEPLRHQDTVTATAFQHELIDIIPEPWTTVSMSLNEECSELFVSRYRHGQPPLILRLPFSRQKSDDAEDDMFDYGIGKAELADIIELSNYSCHSSVETNKKGAKTNWWSEREALDLRLQELLINIENIWLGGFRGIFSQHERDVAQLNRFRKAFDVILGRHLPSRRAPKRGSKSLALDDQVLELFIGLGNDQDGQVDLDEPLSDLLYFVVDMLQFNGERNAYDEIDFDSMAIEVLDALRSYHDVVEETDRDSAHLILVLDRRLHAFPWESLPCLQSSSVSRVDSMLNLRDRILEMRSERHTISKRTGSYILNPGGDLKGTESTMAPELAKLAQTKGSEWTSIVRREPSEDEFRKALTDSTTLMYFGHGSGAQYIRPRSIRKLEKCSEVVWLMGCSSGAVQEFDELEPYAVPLAYMAAGRHSEMPISAETVNARYQSSGKCMAVLATLWDVTDKDIDRFSLAVGEEWGLWRPPPESTKLPVKTPKKRVIAAPVTPQKTAKTPKTPGVKQTPAAPKTPARSQSRQAGECKGNSSLVQAVAKSRDACYLRYLNGAAPVVYGVPVYLGD
ncbi:unnamed protein product [Zymoseptoria tritici ST99CH_3D1]|nr:unnamed protein product [Zymoseptoria tritici ST99CH_3D1]